MKNTLPLIVLLISLPLSGCIPAVIGATAEVALSIAQERSVGAATDDAVILVGIKNAYLQEDVNELTTAVKVDVIEGRVFLTGSVSDPATRINAVRLAWQPDGVKEVINEIEVSKNRGVKQLAQDKAIAAQIAAKMLAKKDVKSVNYAARVVNNKVYLLVIAQDRQELDDVTTISRTVKGVERVVSHVRLKTDPLR
jgi:osmotically-inducible protein OsmY